MKKGGNSGNKEENDAALWAHVTRSVHPYHPSGPKKRAARTRKTPPAPHHPSPLFKPSLAQAPVRPLSAPASAGFDKSTASKLKKGQLPLEGTLDLHDMTQAEAHEALHRFMRQAIARGKRTLLVITGKGRLSQGVLKRMLPIWLEDSALSPHVLAVSPAHQKDGGTGAFYIRLRKPER